MPETLTPEQEDRLRELVAMPGTSSFGIATAARTLATLDAARAEVGRLQEERDRLREALRWCGSWDPRHISEIAGLFPDSTPPVGE